MTDAELVKIVDKFIDDNEALEMYITGAAGTGKTTSLGYISSHLLQRGIKFNVCAHTHKAVGVLKEKLPEQVELSTLHGFLSKRPGINVAAIRITDVDYSPSAKYTDTKTLLIVDEFSMVSDQDYADIKQSAGVTKVIYVGDENQLPPIKSPQTIVPKGDYYVRLTRIYRQAEGNKLLGTLHQLASYIDSDKLCRLEPHETFIRNIDIIDAYKRCNDNKILLSYRNKTVQRINREIEGREYYLKGDRVFSPTIKKYGTVAKIVKMSSVKEITNVGGKRIKLGDKYRVLETIKEISEGEIEFIKFERDDEPTIETRAIVFGHYDYNQKLQKLKDAAVKTNRVIEYMLDKDCIGVKNWCKMYPNKDETERRNKAWREFLAFRDNVICIDFEHAITVHKSQGSTYSNVFIDAKDLDVCAARNIQLYKRLFYVAISRASETVYTN